MWSFGDTQTYLSGFLVLWPWGYQKSESGDKMELYLKGQGSHNLVFRLRGAKGLLKAYVHRDLKGLDPLFCSSNMSLLNHIRKWNLSPFHRPAGFESGRDLCDWLLKLAVRKNFKQIIETARCLWQLKRYVCSVGLRHRGFDSTIFTCVCHTNSYSDHQFPNCLAVLPPRW